MDGPKRLAFTTLDPGTKPSEKPKKVEKTVRLEVDLLDSTDTTYPEFSYTDLVKSTTGGGHKRSLSNNSEDPFNDNDEADEVAAIAKRLEEKYNKPNEGKKKKKRKWQEDHYMLELGDGYDENDTFIDNSEAFDEILPENMTTKLGGFYINSGRLIFKEMSDDSEDDFHPETLKKTKKRRISSDDDDDDSNSEGKGQVVKKKKIKEVNAPDGEVKKKKKKKILPPGEEKPFKKPKQIQDKDKKKENKSSTVAAMIKSSSPNLNGEGQENRVTSPTENGDLGDHQSVTDAIAAVAMGKEDSNSQDSEEPHKDIAPENIPKLPTNLSADVDSKITELKKQAKECSGKSKFFTAEVNKILLEVEISSKQMTVSNRSAVFGHLAAFLPCSKETLMKRAKTLRIKDLEDKIKAPMEKLTKTVARLMPNHLEKYEDECKKFAQEKLANEQKGQQEKEEITKEKEENQTESDEEESKGNPSENTKKRQTGPRKKFEWDNLTRTLLCDVVRVKMQTFQLSKARSETAEDFCKSFLDSEVRPIWPKGWMQKNVLFKESRPAHASWTNPQKTKKLFPVNKTPGATMAGNLKSNNASSAPPSVTVSKLATTNQANSAKPGSTNLAKPGSTTLNKPGPTSAKSTLVEHEKSTVSVANNSKPMSIGTPHVVTKKITPSTLTYDAANGASRGTNNPINNGQKQSSNSAIISNVSQKNTKFYDPKLPTPSQKPDEKSWGHIVSDILRSSYTSPTSGASPPKPNASQPVQRQTPTSVVNASQPVQRQTLPSSQTVQRQTPPSSQPVQRQIPPYGMTASFMSEFEQFTKDIQQQQKCAGKQLSDNELRLAGQQFLQKQVQQKFTQDKLLQQFKQNPKFNQQMMKTDIVKSVMQAQKMDNVKSTGGQQSAAAYQSKGPSQSPMSAAMGRNPAPKLTPKQLTNVFQKSPESVATVSGNLIKRPGDSKSGTSVSVTVASSNVQKVNVKPPNQMEPQYGRVTLTGVDQLRKSSPQVTQIHSQAKQGQGHVIKVMATQNVGQGQMLTKTNPSSSPVTSNGKPSGLMLYSSPQTMRNTNSVPSITSPGSSGGQAPRARPAGSPLMQTGSTPRNPISVGSYSGNSVGKSPSYSVPNQLPGYPSVNIPRITSQQLANLKDEIAKQQQRQQQQRSAEIPQGSNRPQPGPSVPPHPCPDPHFLLQYGGIPRYKDSMK